MKIFSRLAASMTTLFLFLPATAQMNIDDPKLDETIRCWTFQHRAGDALIELLFLQAIEDHKFERQRSYFVDQSNHFLEMLIGEQQAKDLAEIENPQVVEKMKSKQRMFAPDVTEFAKEKNVAALNDAVAEAIECVGALRRS